MAQRRGTDVRPILSKARCVRFSDKEEVKPNGVRYHLERGDGEFEQKMAEVLCVYREVQVLKKAAGKAKKV
jgi:hypothetical protein